MATADRLSAAQARHVLATFRHVEELLERALRPLAETDAGSLAAAHNDFSAAQAAALREAIAAVRVELDAGVAVLDLPNSSQPVSARWAAATATRLALIALAELDARHLAAYGEVTAEAASRVAQVRERLEEKLETLRRILDRP
ncbi:MAG: hypothetical protein ACRER1_08975 [Gammaproteobacteria bacterium]